MDPHLTSLGSVLARTDERLRTGSDPARIWPTGFPILDDVLSGGFRSGSLVLLAGPQGLGKTTFALQVARNAAAAGRSVVYFSFEHDPESILERLIALESGLIADHDSPGLNKIRAAFEAGGEGLGGVTDRLAGTPAGVASVQRVTSYADRLHLHRSTGATTSLDVIAAAAREVTRLTGSPPMLVVDYLQKVRVEHGSTFEDERVTVVVEGLKDLAIEVDAPVLAVVAADKAGLESGKRMRAQHLRGSTALAYEADVLLVLDNKFDLVARHHLVYGSGNLERFKQLAVVSVEKNRHGFDGIDLEFRKRFEQSRFHTDGNRVAEQLVDERVFVE
jgi:replicative DNA helicase